MKDSLGQDFFDRPALTVAKDILGTFLVRKRGKKTEKYMITEVEAYDGPNDLACHASRGRRTKRTEVLFGEPGRIYIYFTYGMHWLLNFVVGPVDYPAGILIRGIQEVSGDASGDTRGEIINGPARITKKLGLDGTFHGKVLSRETGLWVEPRSASQKLKKFKIKRSARIGVDYAGPIWAKKKYRFILMNK